MSKTLYVCEYQHSNSLISFLFVNSVSVLSSFNEFGFLNLIKLMRLLRAHHHLLLLLIVKLYLLLVNGIELVNASIRMLLLLNNLRVIIAPNTHIIWIKTRSIRASSRSLLLNVLLRHGIHGLIGI